MRNNQPSASGIERMKFCKRSWKLESQCREIKLSDADLGTEIHDALHNDEEMEEDSSEITRRQCEILLNRRLAEWADGRPYSLINSEERLWSIDNFSGQPDRVYALDDKTEAFIGDFKTLYGSHTKAILNTQLRTLAVLVHERYGPFEWIRATLIQPKVSWDADIVEFDHDSIMACREEILSIIHDSEQPDAPLTPGEKQCRYCRALAVCPAVRAEMERTKNLPYTADLWDRLPVEERMESYELASLVQWVAAHIKTRVKDDLKRNGQAYGGKLVLKESNGVRSLPDAAAVARSMPDGFPAETFAACCGGVRIGKLKPELKKFLELKGKAADDDFKARTEPHVVLKRREPSVERGDF